MKKRFKKFRLQLQSLFVFVLLNGCFIWLIFSGLNVPVVTARLYLLSTYTTVPDGVASYVSQAFLTEPRPEEITIGDIIERSVNAVELTEHSNAALAADESENSTIDIEIPEIESPESVAEFDSKWSLSEPNGNNGVIVEETYLGIDNSTLYYKLENGFIKNSTKVGNETLDEILKSRPDIEIDSDSNDPKILIFHTHATESYLEYDSPYYNLEYTGRSTNASENMIAIGNAIAQQLENAGIGVIHDTEYYDYPSYNGSYSRSAKMIERYKEMYPSLEIMLDIHRDGIAPDSQTIVKPVAVVDGRKAAQMMIIAGCDGEGVDMPEWQENLRFAAMLQSELEGSYPTLTRPVMFCYRQYNMHLGKGSILVEIGSHGNSFDEALYSGELLGATLVKLVGELSR